jgi:hypothetical protein
VEISVVSLCCSPEVNVTVLASGLLVFVNWQAQSNLTVFPEISFTQPLVRCTALMQYAFSKLDNDASSKEFCNPFFAIH